MVTVNENDNEPDDMSIEDTLTQATSSGLVLKESRAEIRRLVQLSWSVCLMHF